MKPSLMSVLICVSLSGCFHPNRQDVSPVPEPSGGVESAAQRAMSAYREAMCRESDETARKAESGEYSDWSQACSDWEQRNKQARSKSFEPFEQAMNDELGLKESGDGPAFNRSKLAATARQAAKGFRR